MFATAPGTFTGDKTAMTGNTNTSGHGTVAAWEAYAASAGARAQDAAVAAAVSNDYSTIFGDLPNTETANSDNNNPWATFPPKTEPGVSHFY